VVSLFNARKPFGQTNARKEEDASVLLLTGWEHQILDRHSIGNRSQTVPHAP
jgi:hypothetical protein